MSRIQQLPESVANQIAAGEVIERPASVIKELLENALDAGATYIQVDIEKGGLQLCRVRDNGHGVRADDLLMTVMPHATSKISSVNDLHALTTLGFRGEALASMSSIARFAITSKVAEATHGYRLTMEHKGKPAITKTAHPEGTTVEVADLFCVVPVRRRFLKQPKTEFAHIETVVKRVALSRYDVGFCLTHNAKQIFKLSPGDETIRLSKLLSHSFTQACQWLDVEKGSYRLWGWLGDPALMRSQNDWQYVYINGRMIRDKLVMHAIRQAYEPLLYPGRCASFVLYLEMPSELVDVNVHPTKHEVRFQEARDVHDFIVVSLMEQLGETASTKEEAQAVLLDPVDETFSSRANSTFSAPSIKQTPVLDDCQLVVLSKEVGLLLEQTYSVIFNLNQVYQAMLSNRIKTQQQLGEQPLKSRPLLVPIVNSCVLDKKQIPFELLAELGFHCQINKPGSLQWLSIPIYMPHIDLTYVTHKMVEKSGEISVTDVIKSNSVSFSMLSNEEHSALSHFIIEHKHAPGCRHVSSEDWQAMLSHD